MICKTCHCRFAPFPKRDFEFVEIEALHANYFHITPKTKKAQKKRSKVFDSNDRGICETYIQDNEDLCNFCRTTNDLEEENRKGVETLGDLLREYIHGDNHD